MSFPLVPVSAILFQKQTDINSPVTRDLTPHEFADAIAAVISGGGVVVSDVGVVRERPGGGSQCRGRAPSLPVGKGGPSCGGHGMPGPPPCRYKAP